MRTRGIRAPCAGEAGAHDEERKVLYLVGTAGYSLDMRITLDGEPYELTRESIRGGLAGCAPDSVREYWVEIEGVRWPVKQVIALATGVTDRQRFQSQSSRRWLQKLGFTVGRSADSVGQNAGTVPKPVAHAAETHQPEADVVLVGCVKTKLAHAAPAKDLYVSDYFSKMRGYAESTGLPWFILSAEHGLVRPDEWLEPYERYLPNTSRSYRSSWGNQVAAQLTQSLGPLEGVVVDVHAGAAYLEPLNEALRERGAHVLDQLHGLSFGQRLSWYLQKKEAPPVQSSPGVAARLRDGDSAVALDALLASGGADLRVPGLYSWWVDEQGAADLSTGLGHALAPGLIYVGLAGARRSGGSSSSNTLWGRITTMHLGTKHEFSTLRRSLGSILASAFGQTSIDEHQLTRWMHAHLRLVPVPVADADTLGDLESEILTELDPPLNLAKVATTPLRRQLTALRKRNAGTSDEQRGTA